MGFSFTGVQCNEPDNCAEAERPSSPQSTFTIKQNKPAKEHNGPHGKLDKEPKLTQCHW